MPPKKAASHNDNSKSTGPTSEQVKAIKAYVAQKPDFNQLIAKAKANPQSANEPVLSEYEKTLQAAVKETIEDRRAEAVAKKLETS